MAGLNEKCTKGMPRSCLIQGVYTRGKYLCKNSYLGVKERGGHLLDVGIFSETYGTAKALQYYSVLTEL